ncbi:hypothetical protein RSAG8_05219, partial [Rhizoctonia solani AG-8 WAC10335]
MILFSLGSHPRAPSRVGRTREVAPEAYERIRLYSRETLFVAGVLSKPSRNNVSGRIGRSQIAVSPLWHIARATSSITGPHACSPPAVK